MDHHIRDILKQFVKKESISDGYNRQKIETFWGEQMGRTICERTEKILFKNGILKIKVNSSPLKQELFNNRKRICEMVNAYLGEHIVHVVKIL